MASVNVGAASGIATPLTVLFVVLKLTGVIGWSWWWVFSPLLISAGLSLLVLGFIGVFVVFLAKRGKLGDLAGIKVRRSR